MPEYFIPIDKIYGPDLSAVATVVGIETSLTYLEAQGQQLRAEAAAWLAETFGERCPDFDENCIVCRRWQAFDAVFASVLETPNTTP